MTKVAYEVEYDINYIEQKVRNEFNLCENWYGDYYGSLLESETGLNLVTFLSKAKSEEEYREILDQIEDNFRRAAQNLDQ